MNLIIRLLLILFAGKIMASENKMTYGYVEKVTLVEKNLILSAKLDTGAKSASLNATDITEIEINGIPYLRFTVPTKDGKTTVFQSEYIGKVKIKPRSGENSLPARTAPLKRPVVLMNLKLGDKVRAIMVNLTNRKRFNYPLLLGRDAIIDFDGVVDPSRAFLMRNNNEKK